MLSRTRRLPARRRSVVESLETRTLLSSHTGTMGEAMFMTSYAALHLRAAQSANAPREPRAERTSTRTTSTRPSALSRIEQSTPPEFLQSLSVVTNADGTSAAIIDYRAIEPGVYAATVRWDNGPAEPALIDQPGEFFHEPLIGSAYALKQLSAGQHTLELTVTHTTTHAAATASTTFSIATIEPDEAPAPIPGAPDFIDSPDGLAPDGGESLAPEETSGRPTVTDVFVSGTAWHSDFKNYIQSQSLGDATYGFRANTADNLNELSWVNVNRISVRFSEDVTVSPSDLRVRGVNVADYIPNPSAVGFAYDSATFTATWTLAQPIANDSLVLQVMPSVTGAYLGNSLADVYQLNLNFLPGDATRNNVVDTVDEGEIRSRFFTSTSEPNPGAEPPSYPYSVFHDVDGSGFVLAADFGAARQRPGMTHPESGPEPIAPGGFAAAALAPTHVELFWEDQSHNETGFRIERRTAPAGAWATLAKTGPGRTRYSDQAVRPDTTYEYRLSAINAAGASAQASASATTQPQPQPDPGRIQAPPLSVEALPDRHARLSWPINGSLVAWEERADGEKSFHPIQHYHDGSANEGEDAIEVYLPEDVTYHYRLRVPDGQGGWSYSNTVDVRPIIPPGDAYVFAADSSPGGRLSVFWAGTPNRQDGFVVELAQPGSEAFSRVASADRNQWSTTVTVQPGLYDVRVRSFTGTVYGDPSTMSNVSVYPDRSDIPEPTLNGVELMPGGVDAKVMFHGNYGSDPEPSPYASAVQWSPNDRDFLTGDHVYASIDYDDGDGRLDYDVLVSVIPATQPWVRLYNHNGVNEMSDVSARMPIAAPGLSAPDGLTATASPGKVTLEWDDVANNEHGFIIERMAQMESGFKEIERVEGDVEEFVDLNVSPSQEYWYRVRAFAHPGYGGVMDALYGFSAYATKEVDTADTVPNGPILTEAFAAADGGVNVRWIDRSADEDGFHITRTRLGTGATKTYTVGRDVAQFHDADPTLVAGEQYQYEISAFSTAGESTGWAATATPTGPGGGSGTVTIQAVDPAAGESGPNPGRFIIWRAGPNVSRSLNVNFSVAGTATPATDYVDIGRDATIQAGYYGEVVEVVPRVDLETEAAESVVMTSNNGGTSDVVMIDDGPTPKVNSVIPLTSDQSGGGTTGTLDHDNPDGQDESRDFGGGWRFFPDARDFDTREISRNVLRIRAEITPAQPNIDVLFRSFDVDDPSADAAIDPNGKGRDNRGLVAGVNFESPGPSITPSPIEPSGYQGRLRPTGGQFANAGEVVTVKSFIEGGKAYAEVELATSFQPGDNFRVVASAKAELQNLDPTTGVPTTGAIQGFDGAATEQISVWRRVHVETDAMLRAPGDKQSGLITAVEDFGDTMVVTTNITSTEHEYVGGILRSGEQNYHVMAQPQAAPATLTIRLLPGQIAPPKDVDVELFQDDYTAAAGTTGNTIAGDITDSSDPRADGTVEVSTSITIGQADEFKGGVLRSASTNYEIVSNTAEKSAKVVIKAPARIMNGKLTLFKPLTAEMPHTVMNTSDDSKLYDLMHKSSSHIANRFADAYIEPQYDTLNQFDSRDVPAATHLDTITEDANRKTELDRHLEPKHGSAQQETPVFWAVYVASAFEADVSRDNDSVDEPARMGLTLRGRSVMFFETKRDAALEFRSPIPVFAELARTTVHEVGHQFGLEHRDNPTNIMMTEGTGLPDASFFHPDDIAALRLTLQT